MEEEEEEQAAGGETAGKLRVEVDRGAEEKQLQKKEGQETIRVGGAERGTGGLGGELAGKSSRRRNRRRTGGGGEAGRRGRGGGRGLQRESVCRSSSPQCFPEQRRASKLKRQGERERGRKQLLERKQLQSRAARRRRETELLYQPHGKTPPTSDKKLFPQEVAALHFLFQIKR